MTMTLHLLSLLGCSCNSSSGSNAGELHDTADTASDTTDSQAGDTDTDDTTTQPPAATYTLRARAVVEVYYGIDRGAGERIVCDMDHSGWDDGDGIDFGAIERDCCPSGFSLVGSTVTAAPNGDLGVVCLED